MTNVYQDFLDALGFRESSSIPGGQQNYDKINTIGFIGKYQWGEAALYDLGYYTKDGDSNLYKNDWTGNWSGKDGINSREDFFNNGQIQEKVILDWMNILWSRITSQGLAKYEGQILNDIQITKTGMLAVAHLLGTGEGGLKTYLESGAVSVNDDDFGTTAREYMTYFSGYESPFTVNHSISETISGGSGKDTLNGGEGNDTLLGGTGFDTYNFSSAFGVDVVNDSDRSGKIVINGNWIKGDAMLVVEGSVGNVSNNSVNGGNNGGNNNVGGASTDKVHQLSINGVTYYLKMLSGVLLISESRESLNLVSGDVVKIQGFVDGQFGIKLEQQDDSKFGAGSVVDKWRVAEASDPNAYYRIDPLTLDLDGDGVELVGLSDSTVSFDLDGDGLREHVGWVKGDDGILVYDANGSGAVDNINELFGDNTTLGTVELAKYDDNHDGVIDSKDTIFSELQVWQDYDQDGVSDEGELKHLSDYNITSINVNPNNLVNLNQEVAGNVVLSSSSYNYTVDGVSHTNKIYNLELAINQTDSTFYSYVDEWGNVVDYEVNSEALLLPQSRGYGELHAWNVAMSENPDLFAKMQEIVNLSAGDFYVSDLPNSASNINAKIEEFIYIWAGTKDITGVGRGYDARKLATLEKFIGETFKDVWGNSVVAGTQVIPMNDTWTSLVRFVKERILVQSIFAEEFSAAFYNYSEDKIDYSAVTTADLFAVISGKYEAYKEVSPKVAFDYLRGVEDFLLYHVSGYDNYETLKVMFLDYVGAYIYYGDNLYYESADANTYFPVGYTYYVSGDSVINLDEGNNIITSGSGADVIDGKGGNDIINGGKGDDYISYKEYLGGNYGDDIYIYNKGDGLLSDGA